MKKKKKKKKPDNSPKRLGGFPNQDDKISRTSMFAAFSQGYAILHYKVCTPTQELIAQPQVQRCCSLREYCTIDTKDQKVNRRTQHHSRHTADQLHPKYTEASETGKYLKCWRRCANSREYRHRQKHTLPADVAFGLTIQKILMHLCMLLGYMRSCIII